MKKNTVIVCLVGLGVLNGCGGESSGSAKPTAHNQTLFAAVPQDAIFQPQELVPNSSAMIYTQAGRLVRFVHTGHTLSLVDTKGVTHGAIQKEHNSFLYIPQTATDESHSIDTLVYQDDDEQKTIKIQINSDPLYPEQWHLHNLGQASYTDLNLPADGKTDINMKDALASGYLGKGITVAVVDHGVQLTHPDLNVGEGSMNLLPGFNIMPVINGHGTAVAGIIAEKGWNNIGGRGVAPDAKIISFNMLDATSSAFDFARSHGFAKAVKPSGVAPLNLDEQTLDGLARIYNESWGSIGFCANEYASICMYNQIHKGITKQGALLGFDGKGIIYIKSSANNEQGYEWTDERYYQPTDKEAIDYRTFDPQVTPKTINHGLPFRGAMLSLYQNSPYVTVVGAVTAQGKQASYSGSGANMFISGLGGERPYGRIITTDVMGCTESSGFANFSVVDSFVDGFNQGRLLENANCDYDAAMDGTSAATPVVSGAVADILSVNDDLSWRDVRNILAHTAKQIDLDSPSVTLALKDGDLIAQNGWITNAAGLHFNNRYGFGLIDIDKAIAMAKTYPSNTLGPLIEYPTVKPIQPLEKAIPDASAKGLTDTLKVDKSGTIETVSLQVNIDHERLNDLQVELISPKGTHAIVLNPYNGIPLVSANPLYRMHNLQFTFDINTFWGEPMQGQWTLKVYDANDKVYSQNVSTSAADFVHSHLIVATNNSTPGIMHNWSIQINGHADNKGA
ncbi:hypothetical protein A9264_06320 [Vibrio sp. UCD-FRSSP16_10]|uniref:S8 family serine peptidase n=1 Tax=unclassified Vibrio TaxID=2614977 RepID=UPI0007FFD686|nr:MULTISPECIES: S8 family serine peptidase [unclassified Vibrio]OBT15899.1 hypothetical protein A9264_06320 [Vibrio sp. UCD-FRSSP16_10]OBT17793.1 hypothetical protein A9260_00315 [Vibrio sp. UCD-FRSSP16_30]